MQLYVDKQRKNSEALLTRVNNLGLKAVFVTADCASPGKREADERNRAAVEVQSGISGGVVQRDKKGGGVGRTTGAYIDPKLSWDDIAWIRQNTKLPLGVKGIQCVEDAVRCAEMGVDAIYLSNHGGRALDGSPPAVYTLLELRKLRPDVFDKCEVYIDGGVRRGTDVVKALCLGAKGVGMARPFLYALTYGKEGVMHAVDSEWVKMDRADSSYARRDRGHDEASRCDPPRPAWPSLGTSRLGIFMAACTAHTSSTQRLSTTRLSPGSSTGPRSSTCPRASRPVACIPIIIVQAWGVGMR